MITSSAPSDGEAGRTRNVIRTPWYYGWNIVAAAALYQCALWGVGMSCFTYFVSEWMSTFHVGRGQVMIALSSAVLLIGATAPIAGRLVDKVSTRLLVTLAVSLFSLGMFLISLATALWQIIAIYTLLLSFGLTFAGPLTATTLAVRWFRARRGLALGVVLSGTPTGAVVFPPLVTHWLAHGDWRTTHVYLGLICAALVPIMFFIVRGSPAAAGVEIEADSPRTAELAVQHAGKTWTMLQVAKSRAVWVIVIAFVPFSVINLAVHSNIAPFAKDLGFSLQQAGQLMPVIGVLGLVAKLFFGSLEDRVDTRLLFYFAACCIAVGLVLMLMNPGFPVMVLACGLFSFGEGAALLLIGAIVAAHFGADAYGTAVGIVYFFAMTLAGLGPVLGGYLRDITGSYTMMFALMLALLTPGVISMSLLRGSSRRRAPNPAASSIAAE